MEEYKSHKNYCTFQLQIELSIFSMKVADFLPVLVVVLRISGYYRLFIFPEALDLTDKPEGEKVYQFLQIS